MPTSHPLHPEEYQRRLVELVRAGRQPEELAKKFAPSAQAMKERDILK